MSHHPLTTETGKLETDLDLTGDFPPATYQDWKKEAESSLKGASFEKKLISTTYEDIDLQPIYTRLDLEALPGLDAGPGFFPYTRGTQAAGHTPAGWEICQQIDALLPVDFNRELQAALSQGQNSINLVFNQTARSGGVSIADLKDFSTALQGIDPVTYPLHIDAGLFGLEAFMMLHARCSTPGIEIFDIKGSIGGDLIGDWAVSGKLPIDLESVYNRQALLTRAATLLSPRIKTVAISGLPFHQAGADAVSELALCLAGTVAAIDRLADRGLCLEDVARGLRLSLAIGPFFFMEIAKLRAARLLWARTIEAYGGKPETGKITIHAITSGFNQTRYDPYVNMLRATTEAFAAVVGGADSLQVLPFDHLAGQVNPFSRHIARNTQLILREESHLQKLIDPAGGAYYVEKLTAEVAQKAWAAFQDIERQGGLIGALEKGYVQDLIAGKAGQRQADLARRKTILVGTNAYAQVGEKPLTGKTADRPQSMPRPAGNPAGAYATWLTDVGKMAGMPIGDGIQAGSRALQAGASLEELFNAVTPRTGQAPNIKPLHLHRLADPYETLRDRVEAGREKAGSRPRVFLLTMGPLSQHKARADFSQGFFSIGGFEVIYPEGFLTLAEAVVAASASGAQVKVICSTDDSYREIVAPLTRALKDKSPASLVVLAGNPGKQAEVFRQAGIDEFIYLGADVPQVLSGILDKIGIG